MIFLYLVRFTLSKHLRFHSLFCLHQEVMKQIETILYDFLWGSRNKIKRIKVIQELKCGGLNMINVKCMFMSFKAVWISRLFSCDPSTQLGTDSQSVLQAFYGV